MKIVAVCEKNLALGLQLAGIEGIPVSSDYEFKLVAKKVLEDEEVAILVVDREYSQDGKIILKI